MWLDGLAATGVTAVSLVVLLYFAQLRGWIYFKPQVEEIREAANQRVADARADRDVRIAEIREDRDAQVAGLTRENTNLWAALNASEQGKYVLAAQNEKLLEGLETTSAVIRAIPTPQNGS